MIDQANSRTLTGIELAQRIQRPEELAELIELHMPNFMVCPEMQRGKIEFENGVFYIEFDIPISERCFIRLSLVLNRDNPLRGEYGAFAEFIAVSETNLQIKALLAHVHEQLQSAVSIGGVCHWLRYNAVEVYRRALEEMGADPTRARHIVLGHLKSVVYDHGESGLPQG